VVAARHKDLYRGALFPKKPNMMSVAEVVRRKPAWAECFALRSSEDSQKVLAALHSMEQEEIRLRARMMAAVDEGVGLILEVLERKGELDNTFVVFLGDNGFFFGEHALGPERRFAYEEGIRSPFLVRYPKRVKAGSRRAELVICQDIAPTLIELAGGRPGPQVQGRSLLPLFAKGDRRLRAGWRKSILCEYWAEQAMPWLVGMTYKAVRTDRYKYIHWVNRGRAGELDELYDLDRDPFEIRNLNGSSAMAPVREKLRRELKNLVAEAVGL
jgi:N-acetylglucosamine-6-sulfatase